MPDQPAPDSLIAAKASLAQIRVNQGANRDAIALLVDPPHAVLDAIPLRQPGLVEIEIPPRRPPTGIRSRDFHIQTYASLLRASVGAGQTDRALDAMNRLEALGGGAGVDDIYRQLGDELQKELVRLRNDPHRQVEVRNSFEKFLAALSRRKDSLSYGGVMWLGEAWQGLGRAIDVDRPPAEDAPRLFRAASAAFETVVARAELGEGDDDREFVSSGRLMMVRLRLADCRRRLGDYEAALHAIAPVLKESPDSLETQRAAAQILQDWGASGRAETRGRLLDAVDGPRTGSLRGVVWGWKTLAFRLQRQADAGLTAAAFHTQFLEVRYNAFWCRAQYGKSAVDYAAFQDELIPLSHEIAEFARGEGEIPDDHWKRLDALYRDIQKAVVPGKEPTPLPRRGAAK